jgi:hypothetical protein
VEHVPQLYYLAALIVVLGGAFVVWRSTTSKTTFAIIRESNDALKERLGLVEEDLAATKAKLATTQAELKIIKDLPLAELAKSMKEISNSQVKMLTLIEDIHRTRNDR